VGAAAGGEVRPGILRRRVKLTTRVAFHRRPRPAAERVTPELHDYVLERDGWRCIATRFDPTHRCQGQLTFEHVPDAGDNIYGVRAPSDKYHGVAACLGANSPEGWCSTHRDDERAWLALIEPRPVEEHVDVAGPAD